MSHKVGHLANNLGDFSLWMVLTFDITRHQQMVSKWNASYSSYEQIAHFACILFLILLQSAYLGQVQCHRC